jgi:hypothetical protein
MQNSEDSFAEARSAIVDKGKLLKYSYEFPIMCSFVNCKTSLWSSTIFQIKFKINYLSYAEHIAANFLSSYGGDYKKMKVIPSSLVESYRHFAARFNAHLQVTESQLLSPNC